MNKQLLIYNTAKPVSSEHHRDLCVKSGESFSFAKEANSIPLTSVEFSAAAGDFPIVFSDDGDNTMPLVVMGVQNRSNLFVSEDGSFSASYTPAFLRRYPFIFSSSDQGDNFTLCIDESFDGCNSSNRGERLFDADGGKTQYLNSVIEFLTQYQRQFLHTKTFCQQLEKLDLLEPVSAQFKTDEGQSMTLAGFRAVSRKKLKELSADKVQQLLANDSLELIYTHLYSLNNFTGIVSKLNKTGLKDRDPLDRGNLNSDVAQPESEPPKELVN